MVKYIRKLVKSKPEEKKPQTHGVAWKMIQERKRVLLEARGEVFDIQAKCPVCTYLHTDVEIFSQFAKNKRIGKVKLNINCVSKHCVCRKVQPTLKVSRPGSEIEVSFYPREMVIGLLTDKLLLLRPEDVRMSDPRIYYSAIFHFGSLSSAFLKADKTYTWNEFDDWRRQARKLKSEGFHHTVVSQVLGAKEELVSAL